MKYFILSGEVSGDLHGSNLVKEIAALDKHAVFKGTGGQYLSHSGVEIVLPIEQMSFMGFWEVVKNWNTIRKNFSIVKQAITSFQPEVMILIDYPGFNMRMAKWCKQQGYKVVYYISPKFWAWRENRVEKIKKYVDLMLCILPFEEAFYQKHCYTKAHYIGHPLLDAIAVTTNDNLRKHIALLPGSRTQEIQSLLPVFLQVAQHFPNVQFVIAGMSAMAHLYPSALPSNIKISFDETYNVLQQSKAAVVCSGTATLETALFNIPQVVVYKTSWLNYQIGKRVAKVQFISLPNLIVDKKIITELIQQDCTAENISNALNEVLTMTLADRYNLLYEKIGTQGASKNAAKWIQQLQVRN